jgi:cobalt-zinc-cadmium efflux system outer membrane protein
MRVHWNQGAAEDEAVASQISAMLDQPLTPEQAVQIALLNNRRLQATYEDLMVAQADLVQAGLLRNPVFDAEVIFAQSGGATVELSLVQDFMHVFQIPLRKKIAGARFEAAKLRVAAEVIDKARDVYADSIKLIAATQMVELRRTVMEAGEASYDLAKRLHEAGNITKLSLAIERTQYEQAKLDLAAAETEQIAMRERLNVQMGLWGRDSARWSMIDRLADPQAEQGDPHAELILQQALDNSLSLAASRQNIESLHRRLGLERTYGLLPEFDAGAKGDRDADSGDWAVGPVFSLPIPLFDQGQASTAAAAAEVRRAQAEYYATAVDVRAAARAAHARLLAATSRVEYYQQIILPLSQEVVDQTQLQYNAMQVGAFDLLQARQQQINAGARYVEALAEYWLARGSLQTLRMGGSGEISMSMPQANDAATAGRGNEH